MQKQVLSYVGTAGHLYWLITGEEHPKEIENAWLNHDCHLSPEDGCEACEKYYEITEYRNKNSRNR